MYAKLLVKQIASLLLLASTFSHAEIQDIRATSFDLGWINALDGDGIQIGVNYQIWKYAPVDFTATLYKIDDIQYENNAISYNHNYGQLTAGLKYSVAITKLITLSPEIGVTYSVLDYRGTSLDDSDKGWYVGSELSLRYNRELDLFIRASVQKKNFAFEDELLTTIGIRYTPYPSYKMRSFSRKLPSKTD